jgi:tetratricopeptide (TPR) repeat protein
MARTHQYRKRGSGRLGRTTPSAAASRPWWSSDLAFCFWLTAITLALYGQVIGHPFINYDDNGYVSENPHVQVGLTWHTIVWSLKATEQANWHPLTWLSHALDFQIFGLFAGGHHLTSVLIHLLNVVLLFLLLRRATGEPVLGFIVAALFAVHPINVESVCWVAERKNVLSTMFFLLTLAAYGWYARAPNWRKYAVLVALFACSLASKPMLVTLPAVLLLLDYWPLGRVEGWTSALDKFQVPQARASRLVLEKLPLFLLSAASAFITLVAQETGGTLQSVQAFPLGVRLETSISAYALYFGKTFWPFSFALYYPNPFDPFLNQRATAADYLLVWLGMALLVAMSLLAWRQRQERPYLFIGWLWYLGTLVPVLGLVKVGGQLMADRYAYVPQIGLFVALVGTLSDRARAWNVGMRWRLTAVAVALAFLFSLAFVQVRYWRSSLDIFTHTLQVTRNNYVANDKIAVLLFRQHDPEAFRYYEAAARIAPWDPVSHEAVAAMLAEQGHYREAIEAYDVVLRGSKDPEVLGLAHCNLSIIYSRLGEYGQARTHAEDAMRIAPSRVEDEIRELSQADYQHPTSEGFVEQSLFLEQVGRLAEARAACREAAALSPGSAEVQKLLDRLNRE